MGTWGITAFEDDSALEFYDSYCENGINVSEIERLAETIIEKNYDLELDGFLMDGFDEPLQLFVASEIISASFGSKIEQFPSYEYHKEMEIKLLNLDKIRHKTSQNHINKIISAIRKIQSDEKIHYYTLWEESENFDKWLNYSNDLIKRLENINISENQKPNNFLNKLKNFFKK